MWRTSAIVTILALTLLLAACGGRDTHQYVDNKDVRIESISHVQEGDFLVVSAVLRSTSSSAVYHPVYRMEWYDANGVLLEQTSWRPLIAKGAVPIHVKERSTVPGAVEYTLVISNDAS